MVVAKVLVTAARAAEILVAEVEAEIAKDHLCTVPYVTNVVENAKYHFAQLAISWYIVTTVLIKIKLVELVTVEVQAGVVMM